MEIKNIQGLKVTEIKQLVNQGARFVIFPYTISLILMTLKRNSSIYFIRPGESSLKYSYGHVGVNLILGWWGIPWGPIYTIGSAYRHIVGGKDVTQIVLSELIQNDPDADTSTYVINDIINQYKGSVSANNQTYNIPR
jgi:hypothetical protein